MLIVSVPFKFDQILRRNMDDWNVKRNMKYKLKKSLGEFATTGGCQYLLRL